MSLKNKIQFRSLIKHSAKEIFDWHLRCRKLERCIPPFEKTEVISSEGSPDKIGSEFSVRSKVFGFFSLKQVLQYHEFTQNESYALHLKKRALGFYNYSTQITRQEPHASEIIDQFEFFLNCPQFFSPFLTKYLKKRMGRALAYKHELIDYDIGMLQKYPFEKPLRILMSGSHGLIGKNVGYFLEFAGHDVWHLSRRKENKTKTVFWNSETGECNPENFEAFDVVIHLAGENIGKGWWTKKKKDKILKSRYEGTKNLVGILKTLKTPPKTFICASAIGYYGNRGNDILSETSAPGKGLFISEVCEKWEKASADLQSIGIRVVHTRFGMVLSAAGGALKKLIFPFKLGLGGKIGSGRQYISWVAIDDVVGAIYHVMMTPSIEGAVNVVSPNPITNKKFTKKLAKRFHRWVGPPIPEFIIRLIMGQKGKELLLSSTRVEPRRLFETGYNFRYSKLSQVLEHVV